MVPTAASIATLLFSEALKEGGKTLGKGVSEQFSKLLTLIREKFKAVGTEGLLTRVQEEPTDTNKKRFLQELEYQINQDISFANQLKGLIQKLESVEQVRHVMASEMKIAGNFTARNMRQESSGSQKMLSDIDVGKDVEVGDLEQKGSNNE